MNHLHPGLPYNPVQFVVPNGKELLTTITMTQGLNTFDYLFWNIVNWTISDEFYVYLLFAALCLFTRGYARLVSLALLAISSYGAAIWFSVWPTACVGTSSCSDLTNKFGWLRCIAGFCIGALLYAFRDRPVTVWMSTYRYLQIGALAAALVLLSFADVLPGLALTAPLVFAVLVASMCRDSGPVARLLHGERFQYMGRRSYSIYLMQGRVLPFVTGAVKYTNSAIFHVAVLSGFISVTIFLAAFVYRYVEVPFRDRFKYLSRIAFSGRRVPEVGCAKMSHAAHQAHCRTSSSINAVLASYSSIKNDKRTWTVDEHVWQK